MPWGALTKASAGVRGIDLPAPKASAGVRGMAPPPNAAAGVLGTPGKGAEPEEWEACAPMGVQEELSNCGVQLPSSLTLGFSSESHHLPFFTWLPSEPPPQLLFWPPHPGWALFSQSSFAGPPQESLLLLTPQPAELSLLACWPPPPQPQDFDSLQDDVFSSLGAVAPQLLPHDSSFFAAPQAPIL